jgi:alpha-galactosidase
MDQTHLTIARDQYPALRRAMEDSAIWPPDTVRFEIFRQFGYFNTESTTHMSEYTPYFRCSNATMRRYHLGTGIYVGHFRFKVYPKDQEWEEWAQIGPSYQRMQRINDEIENAPRIAQSRSMEAASKVIRGVETDSNENVYLNVPNTGLIENLPVGCYVEVPGTINCSGIHPWHIETIPPQLAAPNMTNVHTMSYVNGGRATAKQGACDSGRHAGPADHGRD